MSEPVLGQHKVVDFEVLPSLETAEGMVASVRDALASTVRDLGGIAASEATRIRSSDQSRIDRVQDALDALQLSIDEAQQEILQLMYLRTLDDIEPIPAIQPECPAPQSAATLPSLAEGQSAVASANNEALGTYPLLAAIVREWAPASPKDPAVRCNIVQFIKAFYGEKIQLPRQAYRDFISQVNYLVDLGYLIHYEGPWYGVYALDEDIPASVPDTAGDDVVSNTEDDIPEAPADEAQETVSLTDLEYAVLDYAKTGEAFRVEVMRRECAAVAALSEEEYEEFKATFAQMRERIEAYLVSQGAQASWERTGKARGVKYQLIGYVAGSIALASTVEIVAPAETVKARKPVLSNRQRRILAKQNGTTPKNVSYITLGAEQPTFAHQPLELTPSETRQQLRKIQQVLDHVAADIAQSSDERSTRSQIRRSLAETFNVSEDIAEILLDSFIESGDLFKAGTKKGLAQLSRRELEIKSTKSKSGQEDGESGLRYTPEIVQEITAALFAIIKYTEHQNQGLKMADLAGYIGIAHDKCRKIVSLMVDTGVIARRVQWERSRSPHSRKKESMYVGFSSQQHWTDFKSDPDSFISLYFDEQYQSLQELEA